MATIKAIEARSVHQIQSGQVIVDLCSVAKELVENSIDAGATSIEVRFKNNGLDLIEVQDNGSGISPENYESLALKHYTSKLSSFDDLSRLHTFGFRGEALSSLCALSEFRVVTAQANQAPKANRLDFEPSGKLKKTQIVAGQRGTTASVEGLFKRLPVRRRELEKNIKREYGKVLNLLHAYASISVGIRFSVRNTVGKSRNVVVFSTNGNQTTKENIANVYGAKTLLALIPLDLELEFEPSATARRIAERDGKEANKIQVRGHVSRPVFGEGRQTPDRQMFFVNSRPCGLPQIAKAFNEVYKSFNVSQSPFVFADFHMDTHAYDVNVSPDKRTILLHDAGAMIESLKTSLTELFESSDQTVPQSQILGSKQPTPKQNTRGLRDVIARRPAADESKEKSNNVANREEEEEEEEEQEAEEPVAEQDQLSSQGRLKSFLSGIGSRQEQDGPLSSPARAGTSRLQDKTSLPVTPRNKPGITGHDDIPQPSDDDNTDNERPADPKEKPSPPEDAESAGELDEPEDQDPQSSVPDEQSVSRNGDEFMETPNVIQNAFDRMRPRRMPAEIATITIGDKTVTSMIGSGAPRKRDVESINTENISSARKRRIHTPSRSGIFGKHMRDFAAPGSQLEQTANSEDEDEVEDEEEDAVDEPYEDEMEDDEEEENAESIDDGEPEDGSQSYAPSDHGDDRLAGQDANQDLIDREDHEEVERTTSQPPPASVEGPMDYDDDEKKKHEEAEVQRLIQEAEDKAVLPQENSLNRANKLNKGAAHRDSTVQLACTIDGSLSRIQLQAEQLQEHVRPNAEDPANQDDIEAAMSQETAEERLSLTVTKEDFDKMRIIGQFNLGFIIATRPSGQNAASNLPSCKDELFIIDQHASDEKFNFERLQAETVVQNQRLVQPKTLDLTAVEEEIVIENQAILEKNGFVVEVDDSGDEPIGRRCKLVSLPLSKEVVFGLQDLEELIVLLSEMPAASATGPASHMYIPRPGKVRKMFAMRACRSSIMIGKNLTQKQMIKVVRNMGTIDKPWNCPHGRPTMRHLMSLGQWNEWDEFGDDGEGLDPDDNRPSDSLSAWREFFEENGASGDEDGDEDADEDEDMNEGDNTDGESER
ncbi:putative DNA mismatch repair protein [Aspergillus steynii IBT 23096]|uniref:DNA mismatch repair protein PMS1 n=1 Tax=Aspergillus steynii IBT 23096 TaxID=1392250 RepID=A0A2I2GS95_9EURO|nr:putative DNA mismatch repair protein [Aspergillus steynii IBT 23096]PLB55740.1 putative DNA mismatch repair protein [Aspergillus steynii IBT 23096]